MTCPRPRLGQDVPHATYIFSSCFWSDLAKLNAQRLVTKLAQQLVTGPACMDVHGRGAGQGPAPVMRARRKECISTDLPQDGEVDVVVDWDEEQQHADREDRLYETCTRKNYCSTYVSRLIPACMHGPLKSGGGDGLPLSPYMHTLLMVLPFLTSRFHTLLFFAARLRTAVGS
jgi:hypothetical protein